MYLSRNVDITTISHSLEEFVSRFAQIISRDMHGKNI